MDDDYLVGAVEAGCDDLADDVHEVLGLLDDVVDLAEGGGAAHGGLLHRELQLLNVSRHLV